MARPMNCGLKTSQRWPTVGMIDCQGEPTISGSISQIGGIMGLGNPLGRLRMHLRLQMDGWFIRLMANHGHLGVYPTPLDGVLPHGQVEILESQWVWMIDMLPIHGHI